MARLQEAVQQKLQADVVTAACCIGAFGSSQRWEEALGEKIIRCEVEIWGT